MDGNCRIQIQNRQRRDRIDGRAVVAFCRAVLDCMGTAGCALSVVFVGPEKMRRINKSYLGHDYATDVLSFSYGRAEMDGRRFLGEIVIAPDVAAANAAGGGVSREMELRKLLVHGILHLLGYNHETDKGRMNRLQNKLLRRKDLARFPLKWGGKRF